MMRALTILLLAAVAQAQGLQPVEFLLGEFSGKGKHAWGEYEETLVGEWTNNKTLIAVRTRSTMKGKVIYADLRIFSYDAQRHVIRMRQFAADSVAVYDVVPTDGGLICTQTGHEGQPRGPWRYTYELVGPDEFRYRVEAQTKEGYAPYVSGTLRRRSADPTRLGPHSFGFFRATLPRDLEASVHHPNGAGPFPVIVFSPGGPANSTEGYDNFGRWFASWGYVTVIVAFDDATAAERAPKYGAVADWLAERNAADDFSLKGKLDLGRLIAGGHSRGGFASVLAARADKRFVACVALAPSGPEEPPAGEHHPATLVLVGDRDTLLETCRKVYADAPKPRYLVTVADMNHFFSPRTSAQHVLSRTVAFLNYRVKGDARFKGALLADAGGVRAKADE